MATQFTIDFEDMSEDDAAGLGLWLDAILREETEHTVRKVSYVRNWPDVPRNGGGIVYGTGGGGGGTGYSQTVIHIGGGGGRPPADDPL